MSRAKLSWIGKTTTPKARRGLILVWILGTALAGRAAPRPLLHAHLPPAPARAHPLGILPSTNQLKLAIALPLRNQEALGDLLKQIYDPLSPRYHQFLTPAQFAEQFGPAEKDYHALLAFAKSHRLSVTGTHPNRTLLDVVGSVADIAKAFHTRFRLYRHPTEPRNFYAPEVEPSVDLDMPLLSISGLDDFIKPRPMNLQAIPFDKSTNAVPHATGSGPRGNFFGKDFRAAYAPGVTLDGAGESVGIFAMDGYYAADVIAYENLTGLPNVPLTNIVVGEFSSTPRENNVEVALDIQMAISMAPGLERVLIYEGYTANDVLNRMATGNEARQLSCSWGFGPQVDPARQQIFQQFAAQGQTFFQASGDLGAYPGEVFPPSDDPFITVVGGTTLITTNGEWLAERVWPLSGGGISQHYPLPSWQQGFSMANNLGSTTMRNLPDVAAISDISIWIVAQNGVFLIIGGTSAAAPLWAGFAALANQHAAMRARPAIGFVNPALYALGKSANYQVSFHDITVGNNTNDSTSNRFFAVPGYDLCTGWGTPAGSNLLSALSSPVNALRITPETNLVVSGGVGGPFTPATRFYSVSNFGPVTLSWTLNATASWLNASPVSGTLLPGGPAATIAVTPNPTADTLAPGNYLSVLTFTNQLDQSSQSRFFRLAVVTAPRIHSQPADEILFEGMTATFTVDTASNALLFYQWQQDDGQRLIDLKDDAQISGANSSTLTIEHVSPTNQGAYWVRISNAAGTVLSSNAFLSVLPWRPVVLTQPTSQLALPGQTVQLSVTAGGSAPLTFRWQKNGVELVDAPNLSGSGAADLILKNVSPADAGSYSVVVTNSFGSITSAPAALAVQSIGPPTFQLNALYSFTGTNDGGGPNGLAQGADGHFYGTTQYGGTNGLGGVFKWDLQDRLTPLASFSGPANGARPFSGLVRDPEGRLFGSTFQGGAFDNGTIFKVMTNGSLSTVVSLNITNGDFPYAGLTAGPGGILYGTTYKGGPASSFGTVFSLSNDGNLKTLYAFSGSNDGAYAYAGVAAGRDGALYGTTYRGGEQDLGTVYRLASNGSLMTLFSFDGARGALPYAGLARGSDGTFYGVASAGGAYGRGTIFSMSPGGSVTNLYSFSGAPDGSAPRATLLAANDGNFYGTTSAGGAYGYGTLFRVAPNGGLATLAHFDGFNGANPEAPMIQGADGRLYGTTRNGGAADHGAIFVADILSAPEITMQPVSQTVFEGADVLFNPAISGSAPLFYQWREHGDDLDDGGNIQGSSTRTLLLNHVTVLNSGVYSLFVSNALGSTSTIPATLTVTSSAPFITLQPTNQTVKPGATVAFVAAAKGNFPLIYQWTKGGTNLTDNATVSGSRTPVLVLSAVTEANNGVYSLRVTNALGWAASDNAVLLVVPVSAPGTRLTTLLSFSGGNNGSNPTGLAEGTNGYLYGTTRFGGTNRSGTVYRIGTNGAVNAPFVSFPREIGGSPVAPVIRGRDGNFYGTAVFGGSQDAGSIFRLTPQGVLTNIYSFTGGLDGAYPYGPLFQNEDGAFYGTTYFGGTNDFGNVFKLTPDGMVSPLYSFANGIDGANPTAPVIQGRDGALYGSTSGGGLFASGNIFQITPENAFTNLYSFTGKNDGWAPAGRLVQGEDGNLFGVTKHSSIGSFQFYGTIYKLSTNGTFKTVYTLNFTDGSFPYAGLIQGSDGNFYGTTHDGGASDKGTLFRIAPNGAFATLVSFDGFNDGAHPETELLEASDGNIYGTTPSGGPGNAGTVFRLSFTGTPQITAPPVPQAVAAGGAATFAAAVFGARPLAYQWQKDGIDLHDGPGVSGATSRVLTLRDVTDADQGSYSVFVRNVLGSTQSSGAALTVLEPPVFQSISKLNGEIILSWKTISNRKYQLQFAPDLHSPWSNLGSVVTGTGSMATAADPLGNNRQRFYRVILLP